ncbi:hypothetical protein N0V90_002905 [Kalmusia sp. IMI 367209]|nr:hypothetical protein N0V90_002905 [Kalmusia sp. IMI 367209]
MPSLTSCSQTQTLRLQLLLTSMTKNYIGNEEIPDYAILSHTWKDGQEVTFDDLKNTDNAKEIDDRSSEGYRKLRFCAQQAKRDGLDYFWVDTCCIDKSNSSELQEAINSMFRWYKNAKKCYVYLSDVEYNSSDGNDKSFRRWKPAFRKSRWFTRGWTLQELLAPKAVEFFSKEGALLGDKRTLQDTIHEITKIPIDALLGSQLSEFSVAERFSWATNRLTTREEDGAYCLLGIFGIYMSLIYGEGRDHAISRLQKKVQEACEDITGASVNDTKSHSRSHEERLGKICNWLSAPDPSTNYHKAHKQRQAETGIWLVEGEQFTRWKSSAASRLWLYGIPGCGKTILSSTVIKNLLQHCGDDTSMVTAYFYFDFNDTQKQDPELMLRSLLCQLLQRAVTIPKMIDALFASYENGRQPSSHAFLEVVRSTLQEFAQVYIVLDALDECKQRSELMDMLKTVAGWQLDNVHLLMTSRKERDIESSLESFVIEEDTVCLQKDVVDEDIKRYSLATLPQTLDQTYDRILSAISEEDSKYAIRILQWLTFSARPLTVEEIAEVVAIDVTRDPAFNRDEVLEDPLEALNICSSLITITMNKPKPTVRLRRRPVQRIVALAHYSVQEYLVSNRIKQGSAKQYSMQEVECQNAITRGSLKYLTQFQQPLSTEILEASALARYAAEFWSDHLRKTGDEIEGVSRLAMDLLSIENPAYLTWIQLYDPDRPYRQPEVEIDLESVAAPLYFTALLGLSMITKMLLNQGAEVNAQGGDYGNALQAASAEGHEQIVKILLDSKAEVNAPGGYYGNALQAASASGNEHIVKILLNSKAEVNAQGGLYGNALVAASYGGHEQIVKMLLNSKAEFNVQGRHYGKALEAASYGGHEHIVKILLAYQKGSVTGSR